MPLTLIPNFVADLKFGHYITVSRLNASLRLVAQAFKPEGFTNVVANDGKTSPLKG
jgi:hypothetical protein